MPIATVFAYSTSNLIAARRGCRPLAVPTGRGDASESPAARPIWKDGVRRMSIEKRTYADADRARAAIDELSSKGFSDVKASFKPDRVQVVVNARFGEGRNAAEILDRHEPLASDEAGSADDGSDPFPSRAPAGILSKVQDPATPLSNILGLPVLSRGLSGLAPKSLIHDPAPLSNWLNWPTLYGVKGVARKAPVAPAPDSPSKDKEASSATLAGEERPDNAPKDEEAALGTAAGEGRPSRERRRPHAPS
jgi:hypothetical protein